MAVKRQTLVGDFETTTTPDDVRVWASCAVDVDSLETVYIGNDIDGFMEWLKNKNTVCYFHNLKFDGEFILHYLLTHGYKYEPTVMYKQKNPKTFECLITDDGLFYSITVYFEIMKKTYKKVVFQDSLKKLPFKVSTIAKGFELEDQKLVIDYDAPRPKGHILTPEEEEYIVHDCRIVAAALQIQLSKGLKRMTNASDALHGYKGILKGYFENFFPILPTVLDSEIRQAYKGGFTWLNPRFKNVRGLVGVTLDVNSLYPSRMYDCLLPYGYPMFFEGEYEQDENFPLYIVRLRCAFRVKPNHIPTIQLKKNRLFVETEYLESSADDSGKLQIVEMTLTSVDLALFREHYDIFCEEYVCGWKFKAKKGLFKEYIDYWMHIKETTTGAMRQLAKLMLNSLYGKFASATSGRKKIPMLDHDEIVRYTLSDPEERDPVYTPMACFITAYARDKTIRSAQTVYDRFIYADTDSLHLVGEELPEGLEVHPTKLGAWKHEGTFTDSKYIRAKSYMETMHEVKKDTLENYASLMTKSAWIFREPDGIHYGKTIVTCAGMPDNVKQDVTYENFHSGSTFDGKLMPRRFRGGIVLIPTTFTIK